MTKTYRVVLHLDEGYRATTTLVNVRNLLEDLGVDAVEEVKVVVYADGVYALRTGDRHEGAVRFALCRGGLETHGLVPDDFRGAGFELVSSGVAELVRLQAAG
ncbi:hypothetical protein ABH15_03105 [Methanoculleus taiwanensis]|uniref:Uncharacterized protein n=1 Tax=Methanoculleus taiwanensis TaxID=1550565 RepID=A0A498H5Z6_9EURY|nr:hypothetical protein [Methanoculleus taiwanensis]RXE57126.1 hypothetical protein ABH15_03105 [Methanoculleus taiwanensis]